MSGWVLPVIETDPDLPDGVVLMWPRDFPKPLPGSHPLLRKLFWRMAIHLAKQTGDPRVAIIENVGGEGTDLGTNLPDRARNIPTHPDIETRNPHE